jgi:hypothetical protein
MSTCHASQSTLSIHPVALSSQKEVVRLLSLEHGFKKASELTGVPYGVVRQWSVRGKWKTSQNVTSPVQTAVNNVQNELQESERETRLSLARSTRRLAKDSETVSLRDSKHVKNVAQTAAIVHNWDQKAAQTNVMVNVALLGIDPKEVRGSG